MLDLLKGDPQVVLTVVNAIELDVSFFHNVQELSGGIGSNFGDLVGLEGWGSSATPVQFDRSLLSQ